ncbi:efflux RND transporter periplasmic adaptor subunit [Maribellus sp. YY47]|uniref:efflux RND transporter periplasmic adaptor subunit n=1 Tax=Maribellus sp. YY47 TaxID=2929486 RepID=UPI002000D508|nr:efflux RND transporter periplasmic adaptor subunit [Maribellus sp. YY47]MCK3683083.1 efflux RND transporter periplasmic adaptor subunit [Maribellus sp. YY47]
MMKLLFTLVKHSSILSFILVVSACSHSKVESKDKKIRVKTKVIRQDSNLYPQEYIGTVEGENTFDLSFLVHGTIEQLNVYEGQGVLKGQLLAVLNTTSLMNAHELSLAKLRQAEDAYNRMSAMYDNKSLPEIQFVDIKTQLEQAQASEAIARKNLQDCYMYASQDGVIGKRYLEPGANVMPGTPVLNLVNVNTVKIKTAIPEGEISAIKTGTICHIQISALGNETFEGRIVEKGVLANPISHTYDIKAKVDNPHARIMPGMVCRVYLQDTGENENVKIIIPIKSIQVDYSGNRFVWLRDKQNKAIYREVTLGKLFENGVQIIGGLETGDELIVSGYQNISEGTEVLVNN